MDKKPTTSNTKAQILEAYDELLKQLKEKSEDNPKEVQHRKNEEKMVESARVNTEVIILKDVAKLKSGFLESLEKVENGLINERKKLAEIQDAIKIEKKNLENLYGLSTNADSFAAILLAQKEEREKFDKEKKEAKETFEAEMAETKANWSREKANHEKLIREEKEIIQKTRKREEEEYNYNLQQKHKKEANEFELKKSQQEADLKEKKIGLDKEFAEREKNIAEKEHEFVLLKQASDNFPKEMDKAVQQAKTELESKLTTVFKYEKDIKEKEIEGQIQLKNLQITTLENKIKEIEAQIKILGQKTETSEKSVKDIAIKAIESSTRVQFVDGGKKATSDE